MLGDGARLTYVTLQDWADDAVHHSTQRAVVGRDASLKHVAVTFGGSVVRHDVTATYDGPGGDIEMLGLYFADAGQHIEHRLFVDHNAPKTRSRVTYKGALQGQGAHTVWIGNVLIRKEAEGIDTYEENRNLVLTDGCQADSVPNLEIETGEIAGAGHASATGRFDDEQLFYLRSRGISEKEARRLVVHGFFNDLIRRIAVPELEEQLAATVEAELSKNVLEGRLVMALPDRACALADLPRTRPSASPSTARTSPSPATATRSSPIEDMCSHAAVALSEGDSRTAPSSAGCTGRASTCAPASPPASRRRSPSPPSRSTYATETSTSTSRPS